MKESLDSQEETNWKPRLPKVPATWAQVDFEAAFEAISVNKSKVPAKSYLSDGALPIVDQGQAFIGGYTNDLSLAIDPGGGVIVFGDHTRTFKRVDFPFAAGADGIKVLHPVLTGSRYAYYACRSLQFPNKGYSRHYSYLNRCKFPIAPAPEQERIVSKIDELFSEIEEGERTLERVQKLVERYRQSVLKAAVTGELSREWREKHKSKSESGEAVLAGILKARREAWEHSELEKMNARGQRPSDNNWKSKYKEPIPPDTADLPELPDGWVWSSLDQLTSFVTSGSRGWARYYSNSGSLFLRVGNMNRLATHLNLNSRQYVKPPAGAEGRRTITREDDLVISITADVGMVAVIPAACVSSYVNQHLSLVRPVDVALSSWMAWSIASPIVQAPIRVRKQGATKDGLTLDDVRAIPIPVAAKKELEDTCSRIANSFAVSDVTDRDFDGLVRDLGSLRQVILKAAFSGRLLSQVSTDQPASVLLEQIAAKRNQQMTKTAFKRSRRKKATA